MTGVFKHVQGFFLVAALVLSCAFLERAEAQVGPTAAQPSTVDLGLRAVLDSVTARHPTVLAARARAKGAAGARLTAGSFANPTFSYQVENAPVLGAQRPQGLDRETMEMVTLPLEPLYQRGPRTKQADAQLRGALAEADAITQTMLLDAARAFYRVAQAQVRFALTREVANWLDTVVAYNRTRVEEGVAAEADLIRVQLERDRIVADATTRQAELVRAQAELGAFTGTTEIFSTAPVIFETGVLPLPPEFAVGATVGSPTTSHGQSLLLARPDVRAARERTIAAGAAVATERSMLFREIGATLGTKQMLGTTSLIAGFSVPIPAFDRNRGEVARASAERDAAMLDLEASTRTARAQLAGAIAAAQLLTERASVLSATTDTGFLARAEQAKRISLGAYREGAVPLLQVIDAVRAWSDARMTYFDLLFAQHQSVLDLLYASGSDIRAGATQSR